MAATHPEDILRTRVSLSLKYESSGTDIREEMRKAAEILSRAPALAISWHGTVRDDPAFTRKIRRFYPQLVSLLRPHMIKNNLFQDELLLYTEVRHWRSLEECGKSDSIIPWLLDDVLPFKGNDTFTRFLRVLRQASEDYGALCQLVSDMEKVSVSEAEEPMPPGNSEGD